MYHLLQTQRYETFLVYLMANNKKYVGYGEFRKCYKIMYEKIAEGDGFILYSPIKEFGEDLSKNNNLTKLYVVTLYEYAERLFDPKYQSDIKDLDSFKAYFKMDKKKEKDNNFYNNINHKVIDAIKNELNDVKEKSEFYKPFADTILKDIDDFYSIINDRDHKIHEIKKEYYSKFKEETLNQLKEWIVL